VFSAINYISPMLKSTCVYVHVGSTPGELLPWSSCVCEAAV